MNTKCVYGKHMFDTQKIGTGYVYTDIENGVPENTPICPDCYEKHILKFYPDSFLAVSFAKMYALDNGGRIE